MNKGKIENTVKKSLPEDPVFDISDKAHFDLFFYLYLAYHVNFCAHNTYFYDRDKSEKNRVFDIYPDYFLFLGYLSMDKMWKNDRNFSFKELGVLQVFISQVTRLMFN